MDVETPQGAIEGKRWRRGVKKYCVIVILDFRNAFNSARWNCIVDAFQMSGVPEYVRTIIADYFRDRILTYSTVDGPRIYSITGGVQQGSVFGSLLWNIMYDAVLRLQLPKGTESIGFADDVAVVAKHLEEAAQAQVSNKAVA